MQRLTEEMILARSKHTDLKQIKKFNCWGSDLCDVSIIKNMHAVEVLALSVNKITTLKPFEKCTQLQELYLRKNNIQDIKEIRYLKYLPNLKKLWLEENPCCNRLGAAYRAYVLRTLPNLKVLDNIEVTEEEVDAALLNEAEAHIGEELNYEHNHEQQQPQQKYHQQHQPDLYEQRQPPLQQQQQQQQQFYEQNQPPLQQQQEQYYEQRHSPSVKQQQQQQLYEQRQSHCSNIMPQTYYQGNSSPNKEQLPESDKETQRNRGDNGNFGFGVFAPTDASTSSMKDCYQSDRISYQFHYRPNQTDLNACNYHQQQQFNSHKTYGGRSNADPDQRLEQVDRYAYGRENGTGGADEPYRPKVSNGCSGDNSSSVSMAEFSHSHYRQQHNNHNSYDRLNAGAVRSYSVDRYGYRNGRGKYTDWEHEGTRSRRSVGCCGDNVSSVSLAELSNLQQMQQHNTHNHDGRRSSVAERTQSVDCFVFTNDRENSNDWEHDRSGHRRSEGSSGDNVNSLSKTVLSQCSGCHRRPRNRNSSLLSAVLCLVKELDYASLEVVEHTARCRIDELADESGMCS